MTGEITKNSVEVKWDGPASTAGLAGYKIYVNGKEYVTYIPADATGYTIEGLEAGKTYQIEVVAVGDDENATEYAAAELSVTTKSEIMVTAAITEIPETTVIMAITEMPV